MRGDRAGAGAADRSGARGRDGLRASGRAGGGARGLGRRAARGDEPLEQAVRGAAARLARLGVEDADLVLGPMARSALERALGGARRPAAQQEDEG